MLEGSSCPGRPAAVTRPQRFPMEIGFVWGFLDGRAGRLATKNGGFRPGQSRPRRARTAGPGAGRHCSCGGNSSARTSSAGDPARNPHPSPCFPPWEVRVAALQTSLGRRARALALPLGPPRPPRWQRGACIFLKIQICPCGHWYPSVLPHAVTPGRRPLPPPGCGGVRG